MQQHQQALRQQLDQLPAPQRAFIAEVQKDISNTLEELYVAVEELQQQNDDLGANLMTLPSGSISA